MKILSPLRTVSALLCAALAPSLVYDSSAKAATNVYFQFTGTGTVGTVEDSTANNLDGTAHVLSNFGPDVTGALPVYSTQTAGPIITDGLGGAQINLTNNSSIKFNNTGVDSNNVYNLIQVVRFVSQSTQATRQSYSL